MSRLTKNLIYQVSGQGLVLLLGFVGVKFIFGRLGPDAFGIIYFNIVLAGVLTTALELGVLATMVREVAARYVSEPVYVEQLIRTASLLYWSTGIVLFVAVFVAAPALIDHWVNVKTIDHSTATTMLRYLSVTSLIMLPRALYSSLFQGRQRMELNNGIDVASSAIQQVGIIVILARGGDAFLAVQWIATSAVLSTLAYMTMASRLFGWRALAPGLFRSVLRRNIGFTAHLSVLSVLNMFLVQFDRVVVSKLLPIASVGYYSFASMVVIRIAFAATAIGQAALPSFSSLQTAPDAPVLRTQYRKLQDLMGFGMVPLFAAACFGALPVYASIFNSSVAWNLLAPTALLSVGFFMYSTVNVPYTLSVAMGRPEIASRSYVLAIVIAAPIATVATMRFGLTGAATWWVTFESVLYAYMVPRILRRCLQMGVLSWYLHILRIVALASLTYGSAWLLIVVPHSYATVFLIGGYVAASALFLLGAYLLIGPELRATVVTIPRRLARGVS